ncbi:DUF3606 domain-containing protein [Rhizobium leguminosarum]|uniref:DUF3606 domain-containing protein n=1 Tax=Rhizobium leguminosarum TaxID=384 RepID=UPI00399053F6
MHQPSAAGSTAPASPPAFQASRCRYSHSGQDHEVKYEATKEGVSKDAVKKAVKSAGNSRKKVETEIGRR